MASNAIQIFTAPFIVWIISHKGLFINSLPINKPVVLWYVISPISAIDISENIVDEVYNAILFEKMEIKRYIRKMQKLTNNAEIMFPYKRPANLSIITSDDSVRINSYIFIRHVITM